MTASSLIKQIAFKSGLCGLARMLARERFKGCTVVSFHRIVSDAAPRDYYPLLMDEPRLSQLEALLRYLCRWFRFITPAEYVESRVARRAVPFSMLLTFDDGYVDCYEHLPPLLERLRIPATVFLNTASLGGHTLWFQELFAAFIGTPLRQMPVGWGLDNLPLETTRNKVRAMSRFARLQRNYPPVTWTGIVHQVSEALRWNGDCGAERIMSWEQAVRLNACPWITIGGHSVHHPYLPQCTAAGLRRELNDCYDDLREHLRAEFIPFSYPNGGYDGAVACAVADAGFRCAFTMEPGLNTLSTPIFQLHRQYADPHPARGAFDLSFKAPGERKTLQDLELS